MIPAMNFWNKVQQSIANDAPRIIIINYLTPYINGRMSYMIYFKNKKKVKLQDWKAYYI
jgi:hypothetical protein